MRILLTVHQFLPDYSAGTEILARAVAVNLLHRGHDVTVVSGFPARGGPAPDPQYEVDGITVHRFCASPLSRGGIRSDFDNPEAASFFDDVLSAFSPDVVHFFHFSRLGAGLIDASNHRGIPGFYTPTDFWTVCPTAQLLLADGRVCAGSTHAGGNCVKHLVTGSVPGRLGPAIVRFMPEWALEPGINLARSLLPSSLLPADVVALADRRAFILARLRSLSAIVCPTRLMTNTLASAGIDRKLLVQLPYGIDSASFAPTVRRLDDGRPLRIGFFGTLGSHKGCHVLVAAFKRLPPGSATLDIYGRGTDFPDYYEALRSAAGNLKSITFRGTFPNVEMADRLRSIDVLVVPSLWYENAPLVIHSALAAGVPVVASDFPGLSELVRHGYNGLLFPPGDDERLAVTLQRLIEEHDLLSELSRRCERPSSTDDYVDALLGLYTGAAVQPAPSAPGNPHSSENLNALAPDTRL